MLNRQERIAFTAVAPASGEVLAVLPVATNEDIAAAMARARDAGPGWRGTPVVERLKPLARLKNLLITRADDIVRDIGLATGKPPVEALASDLLVCVDVLDYALKHAVEVLADEQRQGVGFYRLNRFHVRSEPYGVVAIIAPWNHPLQLSVVPMVSALISGNAVLLKPSELTPTIGQLVEVLCREAGLPPGVVEVLQGPGEVGRKIIEAEPDLVFFTGSLATGRAVMQAAAAHPIPVHLELGGKDPMIVFADAQLARAARGAVWGAFAHAGQNCVAVERLYVERGAHDRFVALVKDAAEALRPGVGMEADFGPLTRPAQVTLINDQIAEAEAAGARVVTRGVAREGFLGPVVLTDVTHDMSIMRDESFGPVLPIMAFDTEADAVHLANDTPFGLNASVWTSNDTRARRVAEGLNTGNVAINDVLKNIANPSTPFGGVKRSGFGRYHGPEGLRAFCRTKTIMRSPQLLGKEPNWFPYGEGVYRALKALIQTLYGDDTRLAKLGHLAQGLQGALFKRTKD